MVGPISTHGTCPSCGANDAYTDFGGGRGFCHSENKNIFEEGYVSIRERVVKSVTFSGIRGLDEETARLYGIQLQLDEKGDPIRYAFKYPHVTKYRSYYDKKETWVSETGKGMAEFFGPSINSGSAKRLYIVEGEFDAASLYQALKGQYPVLSVPSASVSSAFLTKQVPFIKAFKEVVWAGELDAAGRKCAEKFYNAIPDRFYYAPLTKWKDANEALQAGDVEELKWAALKPQRWTPDNFFCSDDAVRKSITEENPYEYSPTGHSGLDEKVRGLVKGGLTFIKAPPGSGKTSLFRFFQMNQLKHSDVRIGILHMEEQKATTYRAMASYELGVNVNTRDDAAANGISEEEVIEAAVRATKGDRTVVFEMRQGDDPMEVVEYIRLAGGVYGADYIFVDHVQRLAYLGGVDGATSVLTRVASNLAQLAKELNIGIIMISHVNEDGHTKYAKSLEEEAIICIDIKRDKDNADPEIRNTTTFHVSKNRPFSRLGHAGSIYYDEETTLLEEREL